jgi:large subunit ribosomal protein L3
VSENSLIFWRKTAFLRKKYMINTLLGIKKGMTSGYDARGRRVGVTMIQINPNYVTQIKNAESKDGYSAVQIGAGERKHVTKPMQGHFTKANVTKKLQFIQEIKTEETDHQPGQEISLSQVFSIGNIVKVTATSKGKGFQGGVKRWGFAGGPKTHGQSDRHRAPGSVGQTTTPGRVYKGKKMAGHMGSEQVSYLNMEVIALDRQNNILSIKGGVPGPVGGLVRVEKLGQLKGYIAPPEPEPEEDEEDTKKEETVQAAETKEEGAE